MVIPGARPGNRTPPPRCSARLDCARTLLPADAQVTGARGGVLHGGFTGRERHLHGQEWCRPPRRQVAAHGPWPPRLAICMVVKAAPLGRMGVAVPAKEGNLTEPAPCAIPAQATAGDGQGAVARPARASRGCKCSGSGRGLTGLEAQRGWPGSREVNTLRPARPLPEITRTICLWCKGRGAFGL